MNLVLIEEHELEDRAQTTGARVRLTGRRARHLLSVLGTQEGSEVRAGLLNGPLGTGRVIGIDDSAPALTLELTLEETLPAARDVLVLAIPRPRVLARVLESATALGFGRIVLLRTWRVEFGYLHSKTLELETLEHLARLGLEQACRTQLPEIHVERRFRPFVEDRLEALIPEHNRFLAHPGAKTRLEEILPHPGPLALAIGPEGGFLPFEIELLAMRGFAPVSLGDHPLRVETAVPALYAALKLVTNLRG